MQLTAQSLQRSMVELEEVLVTYHEYRCDHFVHDIMLEAVDSVELQVEGIVLIEQCVVRAGTEVFLPRLSGDYSTDTFGVTHFLKYLSNSR